MRARIFQPARAATSSGTANSKSWVLEHPHDNRQKLDPMMGWTSSGDMQTQVRLLFETKEAAQDYAARHGIEAVVTDPQARKQNIRRGGYAENFATGRRTVWTH
ncbi:MAG: ETC complex I subunit [Paracoccaceae bacterium]